MPQRNAEIVAEERNARYADYVKRLTPQTSTFHSLIQSFVAGGATCVIAALIGEGYAFLLPGFNAEAINNIMLMTIVALAIIMTGFGWYDLLATFGGAGTFLPITGFANAIASSSIEFKTEGMIFGTSVKMFSLVGPVVVNGVVWSAVIALVKYLVMLFI